MVRWKLGLAAVLLVLGGVLEAGAQDGAEQAKALRQRMTLEEKVGQIMVGFFRGGTLSASLQETLRTVRPGGVILYSSTGNIESPSQVARLVVDLQRFVVRTGTVPLFVAIDQEGGLVARITEGVTVFPGNMALGATGDETLAEAQGRITARELRALGITWNYAPVVDVNSNPINPVIGIRSFGSDPETVGRLGIAMMRPYGTEGVLCAAKHYPGHGDTDVDSHLGLPMVKGDRHRIETVELAPFDAMAQAGVPAIMTAHVVVPALESDEGLPATMSPAILGRLRRQGFEGLIVSDSLGMGALDQHWGTSEAAVRALAAGCDVLVFGADKGHDPEELREIFRDVVTAVRRGRIPETRLDDAVERILRAKAQTGVLQDPLPREFFENQLATPEHLATAERMAQKSVTLVRGKGLLPLVGAPGTVPLVWPADRKGAAEMLVRACPILSPRYLSRDALPEQREALLESLQGISLVVVGGYDLGRTPTWRDLVTDLDPRRVLYLALRSPYDLLSVPEVRGYLCSYGDRPPSLRALGSVLDGARHPEGVLPVELPGLYPRGWRERR